MAVTLSLQVWQLAFEGYAIGGDAYCL